MCPEEEPMHAPDQGGAPTVLIAEDEVLIRLGIADHLRGAGFNVVEAASGAEARDIILAGVAIDLVFSDINMPSELDGVGLAQWLAEINFEAPVVLTSALPSVLADAQARCANVRAFVGKPYGYDAIENQLRRLAPARVRRG